MLGLLGKSAALRWTLLSAILILFSQGASILDQAWMVREAGFEKSAAQGLVGALFTIGSVAGALVGGPIADLFARRWASGRLIYAMVIMISLGPLALIFPIQKGDADHAQKRSQPQLHLDRISDEQGREKRHENDLESKYGHRDRNIPSFQCQKLRDLPGKKAKRDQSRLPQKTRIHRRSSE
jgi:hypothetical protein